MREWPAIEPPPDQLAAVKTVEGGEVYRRDRTHRQGAVWVNEHGAWYDWEQLRGVSIIEVDLAATI